MLKLTFAGARVFSGAAQVPPNGVNLKAIFDAGPGLMCGASAVTAQPNHVFCVQPAAVGATSGTRTAGSGPVPETIRSIAVDSVDGGPARVLVLGTDSVLRASSGDLAQAWGTGSNFTSWATYVPALNQAGAAVSLKKVVVVRTPGHPTTDILGLTTAGSILAVKTDANGNRRWGTPDHLFPITTIKDISHGTYDLYLLTSANQIALAALAGLCLAHDLTQRTRTAGARRALCHLERWLQRQQTNVTPERVWIECAKGRGTMLSQLKP